MFAHIWMRSAGLLRWGSASLRGRLYVPAAITAFGLLLQACSNALPTSPHDAGRDPSDPAARVPAADYRPAVAPYGSQRPVEPKHWREQNDTVAPQKP
jgi:hypothetical protein